MTPGDYARGGRDLAIDYGFHEGPFGIALVMATEKGVCGLAFGDDGEEAAMMDDMQARPVACVVLAGYLTLSFVKPSMLRFNLSSCSGSLIVVLK